MPRRKKSADADLILLDITSKFRSGLTNIAWLYLKIPQKGFEVLQPRWLADPEALRPQRQERIVL